MDITCVNLPSGTQQALYLWRGIRLVVLAGRLQAQPPVQWLGDTLIQRHEDWHEGHVTVTGDAGVWHWRALAESTLLLCRPQPFWQGWRARLAAWRGSHAEDAQTTGPRDWPKVTSPSALCVPHDGHPTSHGSTLGDAQRVDEHSRSARKAAPSAVRGRTARPR